MLTFKTVRESRGLSLKEVAGATGRPVKTIEKYEKDPSRMPRFLIRQLLDLYQVDGDNICFYKEQ
jgi:transcriptional regulator with XRE-family HTH domain